MLYGPSGGGNLVLDHPVILIQIGFFFHYRTRFYLKTVKGTKKVWNFQGMGNPPKPTLRNNKKMFQIDRYMQMGNFSPFERKTCII